MTNQKNVPTDAEIEENRRALLAEVKEKALDGPWTPEASELVDIIDEGGYCA